MEKKLPRKSLIAKARGDIRALSQPKGVRWDVWLRVTTLLNALAAYLPDPYPSEQVLAEKLGWPRTSIHRTVCRAEALGLLKRNTRSGVGGRWDGTNYVLTCLTEGTKAAVVRARPEPKCDQAPGLSSDQSPGLSSDLKVVLSLSEKEASQPPSGIAHGSAGSGLADQPTQEAGVPRHVPDDDPDPIGADPDTALPQHRVRPSDPGRTLALYFDQHWHERARRSARWRGVRPSDRGRAIGYLKGVMLTQVDPDIARAHIEAFISAVFSDEVELKEGQLPFERFTSWWGRQPVADPVETARVRAATQRLLAQRDEYLRQLELDDGA